jgi:hypothetical protein
MVLNDQGFMFEINLKNLLHKNFKKNRNDFLKPKYSMKETYRIHLTEMTF